jgi:hypothetical protein
VLTRKLGREWIADARAATFNVAVHRN